MLRNAAVRLVFSKRAVRGFVSCTMYMILLWFDYVLRPNRGLC